VEVPDYSGLSREGSDWSMLFYEIKEVIPFYINPTLGKKVTTFHWVDANLVHYVINERSGRSINS